MKVHYARVSTFEQNLDRQLPDTDKKVYWDKCSGTIPFEERDAGKQLLEDAEAGKITEVHVRAVDRLGRNSLNILETLKRFTSLNVCVVSRKEGLRTLTEDGKENPTAKLLIAVLSTIAEIDYNQKKEAQREGIEIAKAKGKYNGRKRGTSLSDSEYLHKHADVNALLDRDLSIREIAKIAEKSKTTVLKVKKIKTAQNQ